MKSLLAGSALALALTGCASIFNGPTQAVTIKSEPAGAAVSVVNRAGEKIHAGTAPVTLTLKRGAGFFKPETYTVSFEKQGFSKKEVNVTGTISGWYIGNILFGGVIGLLAVDPATGAMYVLPDSVNGVMEAEAKVDAPKVTRSADSVRIVSTDSLSPEQMKDARLLTAVR